MQEYNRVIQQLFKNIHNQEEDSSQWFILIYKKKVLLIVNDDRKLEMFTKKYILSNMKIKNAKKVYLEDNLAYYLEIKLNEQNQIEIKRKNIVGFNISKMKIKNVYYKNDSIKYYIQINAWQLQIKTSLKDKNFLSLCTISQFLKLPDFIAWEIMKCIDDRKYKSLSNLKKEIGNIKVCGHLAIDEVLIQRFNNKLFQNFLMDTRNSVIRLTVFNLAEKYIIFKIYKMVDNDSYRRIVQHIARNKTVFQEFVKEYVLQDKRKNKSIYSMLADLIAVLYCQDLNTSLFCDYCSMYKTIHQKLKIPASKTNKGFQKHHDIILNHFMQYELKKKIRQNIHIEYEEKQRNAIQSMQQQLLEIFDTVHVLENYVDYYKEAIQLKHCILNYFDLANQKKYITFSVSKDKINYTLGFVINNRRKFILTFDQIYGFKNQMPSEDIQKMVENIISK